VIRYSREGDRAALERLAALDSRKLAAESYLLSEVDGELVAAAALDLDEEPLSDPFRPTASLRELLRLRRHQIRSSCSVLARRQERVCPPSQYARANFRERPLGRRGWPFDPGFKRNPEVANGSISCPCIRTPGRGLSSHPGFVSVRALCAARARSHLGACLSDLVRKVATRIRCANTVAAAKAGASSASARTTASRPLRWRGTRPPTCPLRLNAGADGVRFRSLVGVS
jgi:hypothetical protein